MKFLLVLLAIVAYVSAEEEWKIRTPDEIKAIRDECLKEHPLSEEQLAHLKNFEYPKEEAVLKYLLCNSVKLGVFCPHSGYHADRIAKQFKMDLGEDTVLKIAEDCISHNSNGDKSNEELSYDVNNCIMKSALGDKIKAYIIKKREEEASH